ncbi:MAG: class I SAM-dependent methyltransferase [Terriglobia bacterium]
MRRHVKELVGIAAATLPVSEPVCELGALQVPGHEGIADLRPFFPGQRYLGCDFQLGPGVNLVTDVVALPFADNSLGAVICADTLEHVKEFWRAPAEVHRVLRPGGWFLLVTVMQFRIHDFPADYYRFTPAAIASLLRRFDHSLVFAHGQPDFPHTVGGLAFKGALPDLRAFQSQLQRWQATDVVRLPRWKRYLKPLVPPILLPVYRLLRDRLKR